MHTVNSINETTMYKRFRTHIYGHIYIYIYMQGVVFLCAHNLTTYKIIIGEHCGVILFAKF